MHKISHAGGATLLAVACLTIMVGCVIVPGLPSIASNLHVEKASGWLVTLPALGVVVFGPLTAKLISRVGLYQTLCLGLFLYGLIGFTGAFLSGYGPVLIDRFLLGGATSFVMTAGTGLISEFYQGNVRLKMIALQGVSIELGGVIFLFVGGLLAELYWSMPFTLYLFAWILLVFVYRFVPNDNPESATPSRESSSTTQASAPIQITWAAALGSMVIFFTAIILLPLHFASLEINASQTGMFLSFISLVAVGAAFVMPKVVNVLSEPQTLVLAFVCYGLGHFVFSFASSVALMIPGGVALGCGFGFSIPVVNHIVVDLSRAHSRGENLAKLSMAIFMGQFLASFMTYLPGTRTTVFTMTAVLAVLIAMALFLSRSTFTHPAS